MNQEQIPKNLSKIQSLITNNQRPQKILSLFYTTAKYIEKKQVTSQKSSYLSSTCFSFYDSDQQLKDCITKYSCKVQDLFNQFLQKNRKLSTQLDKVNGHMLKITSQMITNINQRKLSVLYEKQQNEEPINSKFQVNRMQRVRSMSVFNKFQNLFTNTLDQRNNSPNENVQDHLQQARTEPKIPPRVQNIKGSRLSQKTIESTSSQQNRNSNHQQTPPPKPSTQTLVSIQTILNFYAEHKLDRAFQLLTKLQSDHPQAIQRYNEEHISPNNPNKLTELKQEYEEMIKFYNDFDLKGYKLDKTQDNITMHYKILEKQNLVAIQVQSQVDLTIEKFLCIASEIQLYDKYVPFNYETTCLREVARNKKIGRSKVFIPLLNNRQAYFEAKAYDRLDTQNCIFIFSKNLKKQHLTELSIQYKAEGLIDLDYIFFLLSYTPITKQKGRIRMATCIDLKISILPKFILNKTARIFAFDYFKNMISINRRFAGSPWEKAISNKPEHYSFFREKITEYFEQKDTKQ